MSFSTAISVKTESGDYYLFVKSKQMNTEDVILFLKNKMNTEFAYIGNILVAVDGYESSIDTNIIYKAIQEAEE